MIICLQRWKMSPTIKKSRDSKDFLIDTAWYRPEQWGFLRKTVEDKENYDQNY
jgi:hypothetical protein